MTKQKGSSIKDRWESEHWEYTGKLSKEEVENLKSGKYPKKKKQNNKKKGT